MSLIADLQKLGDSLAAADLPTDPRVMLGALVRYVETGSLEPVTYDTPAESLVEDEKQAEIARLADRVATLEAEQKTAPSPSAPAPVAPSPEAPAGAGGVLPPPSAPAEGAPIEGAPPAPVTPDTPPEAPAASA